ncbi:hypothetical protein [Nonomuraea sp. NPDC048826]|uniref:hypothetical protein n=1 Tax=Nonomuraea sp. NPDC048826 TaxID=3364347 RepID=UPI003717C4E0
MTPRPRLTAHRLAGDFSGDDDSVRSGAVAVLPDGRPVIAYQGGGADLRLLRCRDRDCARTDAVRLGSGLTSPGASVLAVDRSLRFDRPTVPRRPQLLVDRSGRVVLAAYDPRRRALVLATCEDDACDRAPIARVTGSDGPLAMALDLAGRPTVAWEEGLGEGEWRLRITTPAGRDR